MPSMTAAAVQTPALPSFDRLKMEDRKRSLVASDATDIEPSRKRIVKDENGQQMRMDAEKEKEVEVRIRALPTPCVCESR